MLVRPSCFFNLSPPYNPSVHALFARAKHHDAYGHKQHLIEKGLASTVIKSGVVYLDVADPKRIESLLQEKLAQIKKVVPELVAMKETVMEKPAVELYEGKEGLKTILEDILKTKKEFWACANYDIFKLLRFYFPYFIKRRIKNKIFARIIQQRVKQLARLREQNIKEYREMRFAPVTFKSNIFIYGNNVAFLTISEYACPLSYIVDS